MSKASQLDVIRFGADGERIDRRSFQIGSSTQIAPFKIHGRFDEGEGVWTFRVLY